FTSGTSVRRSDAEQAKDWHQRDPVSLSNFGTAGGQTDAQHGQQDHEHSGRASHFPGTADAGRRLNHYNRRRRRRGRARDGNGGHVGRLVCHVDTPVLTKIHTTGRALLRTRHLCASVSAGGASGAVEDQQGRAPWPASAASGGVVRAGTSPALTYLG